MLVTSTSMNVFLLVTQVIGVVVAGDEATARAAAQRVRVTYEDLPAIMSCEEAVEAGAFYRCGCAQVVK